MVGKLRMVEAYHHHVEFMVDLKTETVASCRLP
jgi:hypothetical protein